MKVLASNVNLRKLAERLKVPTYDEIKADAQKLRLSDNEKLEAELADADNEVVRLNYILRILRKGEGHKYKMSQASTKCAKRVIARGNWKYNSGGD